MAELMIAWLIGMSVRFTGETVRSMRASKGSTVKRRDLRSLGVRRGLPSRHSQMRSQAVLELRVFGLRSR